MMNEEFVMIKSTELTAENSKNLLIGNSVAKQYFVGG